MKLLNYVNGKWVTPQVSSHLEVKNPATQDVMAQVPLSDKTDVDAAVQWAVKAQQDWRRTPPVERVQYLFRLKTLLEQHFEELAKITTMECGKTLAEAKGEIRRGIENVEVACGIPTMMQGYNLEDVASGIDETMIRQPVGVVAAITPFNFPGMIPFWFLPYAIACGNAFILKPSEKVPITMQKVFQLMEQLKLPPGVVNLVNGAKDVVNGLLDHPQVRAVSFVGSKPVALYIYSRAAANGKRVQCQGGAKNYEVVMPDADMEKTAQVICESAFGCAGQRCLAASIALTVGEAQKTFRDAASEIAASLRVGYGLDEGVQMGPVISPESKTRIESLISQGAREGAIAVVDGRGAKIKNYEKGNFVKPTLLDNFRPASGLSNIEIFGPVLSLIHTETVDEAIEIIRQSPYGNAASIFTSSGSAARKFRYEVPAGNIGINIGVAAAMAFFPFSGMKDSFFGDLHGQGMDAIEFYTEKKVVIERWK